MDFISFRSKNELRKAAEQLAKLEGRDRSDEYREIFAIGIAEKQKTLALDLYSKGRISMGKAKQIAGVSYWEFIDLMKERNVPLNLTAGDVLAQAKAME